MTNLQFISRQKNENKTQLNKKLHLTNTETKMMEHKVTKVCKHENNDTIEFSCYKEEDYLKNSKEKNQLFEDKLHLKNALFSFPLYPVYKLGKHDILLDETCNIGLLLYMALKSKDKNLRELKDMLDLRELKDKSSSRNLKSIDLIDSNYSRAKPGLEKKERIKTIQDFKFEYGLPYNIYDIGTRFDIKECAFMSGKMIEIREIDLIKNNLYFQVHERIPTAIVHERNPIPRDQDIKVGDSIENRINPRSDSKKPQVHSDSKTIQINSDGKTIQINSDGKTNTSIVEENKMKLLSFIIQTPLVSEVPWKQLSVMLMRKYACEKNRILEHLIIPYEHFDPHILSILREPSNNEILNKFNLLRRQLNSIENSGYIEAMIYALLSSMTVLKWTPLFPRLYDTGRAQCVNTWDIWKQFIIVQHTDSYYADVLGMHSELDLEMVMAHLFQIVFGLDYAQQVLGFIHNNLDVRYALRYAKVNNSIYLYFYWRRKYYRVPTDGIIMKLCGFENSSVIIDGVKHCACNSIGVVKVGDSKSSDSKVNDSKSSDSRNDKDNKLNDEDDFNDIDNDNSSDVNNSNVNNNSFNTDLIRLGATLHKVIVEKQMKIISKHPDIEKSFLLMINKWRNCGIKDSITNDARDKGLTIGDRDQGLKEFKMKCLEDEDKSQTCSWKRFSRLPSHNECCDAVPGAQQEFFSLFEVEKDTIDHNETIYVL